MSDSEKGLYEISLDNKWLIALFVFFVVLLGLVFVWGMKVGKDTALLERGLVSSEESQGDTFDGKIIEKDFTDSSVDNPTQGYDMKVDILDDNNLSKGRNPVEDNADIVPSGDPSKKSSGSVGESTDNVKRKQSVKKTSKKPSLTKTVTGVQSTKPKGEYIVQVISIGNKSKAEYYVTILKECGYSAFMSVVQFEDKGTLYRVRVGGYKSHSDAQSGARKLLAETKLKTLLAGKKSLYIVKQNY